VLDFLVALSVLRLGHVRLLEIRHSACYPPGPMLNRLRRNRLRTFRAHPVVGT
jgi:hypothetical protein